MFSFNENSIKFINICKFSYEPLDENINLLPKNYKLETIKINNINIVILNNETKMIISLGILDKPVYKTKIKCNIFKSYKKNINLGKINSKYLEYYQIIKPKFFDILESFINKCDKNKVIDITGHSIGACILLLGFIDFNISNQISSKIKIKYNGFGCLKLGDNKFTNICNTFLNTNSIINNINDSSLQTGITSNKIMNIDEKNYFHSIKKLIKFINTKKYTKILNRYHNINSYMHLIYRLNDIVLID